MMTIIQAKNQSPMDPRKKYAFKQRINIEELKKKYESSADFETTKTSKAKKIGKVKQMASLFNSRITQFPNREVVKYSSLKNEFSPESQPQSKAAELPKPFPMPSIQFTNEKVSSPRTKSKAKIKPQSICFVAEDVFAKLSVKEKVQLYTQFIEDMSKKNPKFGKHAKLMEANVKKEMAQGEVVNEKQESVKHLLQELESAKNFPQQAKSPVALQRMDSMKRVCLSRRKSEPSTEPTVVKYKEFEDISMKNFSHKYTFIQPNTVVRKPRRGKSLPRTKTKPLNLSDEKATNQTSRNVQQSAESNKIFLTPKKICKNLQLENLFFTWYKHHQEEASTEMSSQSEIEEEKHNLIIDKMLEETIDNLDIIANTQKETNSMEETQKPNDKLNTTPFGKTSETEESESGFSSLLKIASEESQPDNQKTNSENSVKDFKFVQPLKTMRKKKTRRVLKENNTISSTDSETDCNVSETKTKNTQPSTEKEEVIANEKLSEEPVSEELNQSLLKAVNSPGKIKSAYTLTVNDLETSLNKNRQSTRYWPTEVVHQISMALEQENKHQSMKKMPETKEIPQPQNLVDCFTDQGFETDSSFSTPVRLGMNIDRSGNKPQNTFVISTPNKNQVQKCFSCTYSAKQQQLSPSTKLVKNRRKSLYDNESRRNSSAMQVIREDQPLENTEVASSVNGNVPSLDKTTDVVFNRKKMSMFWIKCGDFTVAFDVNYTEAQKLRLLYETFGQKSSDTKDLHFGIDNHKFSTHSPSDLDNISTCIPKSQESSQYWFLTGDMPISFTGKYLTSEKILRVFQFVKASVEESGVLRFGVDDLEFSNVVEFCNTEPKFSMESNYSLLVGLQSGNSNGLEGRNKYAWPYTRPVPVTDLDQSDFENADFKDIESQRLSFTPSDSYHYDLSFLDTKDHSMPRNSDAMDSYCHGYENEPLDNLFNDQFSHEPIELSNISQMVTTIKNQRKRLSFVQPDLSSTAETSYPAKDALDALKGTPEYLTKLKSIIADISSIGCRNNFTECSVEQLDSYIYYLNIYADICVNSCSDHKGNVLDALFDYKPVYV